MKFLLSRDKLLHAIQQVAGVVERKGLDLILSHIFVKINSHQLRIIGTDLDVEICAIVTLAEPAQIGEFTVPARKMLDICRALPEKSEIKLTVNNEKAIVTSGKSRFTLATLPSDGFPKMELAANKLEFNIESQLLKDMFHRTLFSVANQDVRFYLNGLLMQLQGKQLYAVATDGHRLSMFNSNIDEELADCEVIIPKKAVVELQKILNDADDEVKMLITDKHLAVNTKTTSFIAKLIDGKFPDYNAVIPKNINMTITLDKDELKHALNRVAILSNEKYKGVNLSLSNNKLALTSKNPEQEEAEEELIVEYNHEDFTVGFNVAYLLDVLNHIPAGAVEFSFVDQASSVLIKAANDHYNCAFVVMPMRI